MRHRLAFGIVGAAVSAALFAGTVILVFAYRDARAERLARLADVAESLAQASRRLGVEDERFAFALRGVPWSEVELVEVVDLRDGTRTRFALGGVADVTPLTPATALPNEAWPTAVRRIGPEGEELGVVAVRGSSYALTIRTARLALILLAVIAGAAAAAYAVYRRVAAHLRRQVVDLAEFARVVATRRDYSIRAVRRSDDELGKLVDTVNHMITQVELSDAQLRREVTRAEAASEAKARFLATMSHELRTPLHGVMGMTQLLDGVELDETRSGYVGSIHRSAERLLACIDDVLLLSRAGDEVVAPAEERFRLDDCVDETARPFRRDANEKGLELAVAIEEDVSRDLVGDPQMVRTALGRLIDNAVKFTARGRVDVRVTRDGDERLRFEVSDTGVGIETASAAKLFEPFTQVESAHDRRYGGAGLGLAVVRQVVVAMRGEIFARARDGRGAVFGFAAPFRVATAGPAASPEPVTASAPATARKASARSTTATGPAAARKARLLVVEPDEDARKALEAELGPEVELAVVASWKDARRVLGSERGARVELLVIDLLTLRGIEGGLPKLPGVRVVAAASKQVLDESGGVSREIADTMLLKPLSAGDLEWCLSSLGAEARPLPPLPDGTQESGESAGALMRLRTLVAEDNPVNQQIVSRFLDRLGLAHDVVADGREAVRAYASGGFELVLMDVQMPGMDGLAATRAIRRMEREQRMRPARIIAMTANSLPEDRAATRDAGCDHHVEKPVRWKLLRDYLESLDLLPAEPEPAPEAEALEAACDPEPAGVPRAFTLRRDPAGWSPDAPDLRKRPR